MPPLTRRPMLVAASRCSTTAAIGSTTGPDPASSGHRACGSGRRVWPKLVAVAIGARDLAVRGAGRAGGPSSCCRPGRRVRRLGELIADGTVASALAHDVGAPRVRVRAAARDRHRASACAVARRSLRAAVGSMITGLQTMPSIAWFPLAILLFQLTEEAILFVVVLGAAPSIANGLIAGVDHVPPILLRPAALHRARGHRLLPRT